MPEPTYRIAQALHARRAAVGLKKYGQHLTADSPGCMLVHALEEAADQVNYLIAEIQRRRTAIKLMLEVAEVLTDRGMHRDAVRVVTMIDLLGGEAALAKYDEILGGAEDATVAPEPTDVDAQFDPQKIVAEAVSRFATKHTAPDPRDEALRVATEALEKQRRGMENILEFRQLRTAIGEEERFGALTRSEIEEVIQQIDGYIAAIRGAR